MISNQTASVAQPTWPIVTVTGHAAAVGMKRSTRTAATADIIGANPVQSHSEGKEKHGDSQTYYQFAG